MAMKWSDSNTLAKYHPATQEHFVLAIVSKTTEKQRNKCLVYMQVRRESLLSYCEMPGAKVNSQLLSGEIYNAGLPTTRSQETSFVIPEYRKEYNIILGGSISV